METDRGSHGGGSPQQRLRISIPVNIAVAVPASPGSLRRTFSARSVIREAAASRQQADEAAEKAAVLAVAQNAVMELAEKGGAETLKPSQLALAAAASRCAHRTCR